jgi:hypothetical protein
MNLIINLDSSTISKRYIIKKETNIVDLIFDECAIENTNIFFSIWNNGGVLGVSVKYHN